MSKKFSKAQEDIIQRLWFGDIIEWDYIKGYRFLRYHHSPIKGTTICALEDVISKTVTDEGQVLLTLNSEAVVKTGHKFKRKEK